MVGHNYYQPNATSTEQRHNEDVLLTLRAMVGQEERYAVLDYLYRQNDEDHLMLPVMPSESSERNNSININRRSSPSSGHSPSANAAVPARRDLIDSDCRTILVEWAYRVVDHFHIGREVVAYAMNYVDRFCSHHFTSTDRRLLDKNSYKLIVTSSLYLALKLHHEGERAHQKCFESSWHYYNRSNPGLVSPTVEDYDGDDSDGHRDGNGRFGGEGMSGSRLTTILPYLTRGEHTQAHLDRFETVLIQTMGFYLHPPLAACFVEEYMHVLRMSAAGSSSFLEDDLQGDDLCHEANIFVDLSVAEYDAATVRPSLIALAALLNAMTLLERQRGEEDDESSRTLLFQSLRSSLLEKLVPSSQEEGQTAAVAPLVPEAERQPPSPPFSSVSRDMVSNNTVASVSCCPILKNHDDIQDLKNIQILLWELRFDSSQEGYESPVNNDPSAASAAAMDVEQEETRQDSSAAGRAGMAAAGHNHKSNHGSSSGSDNDEDDDDDNGEDMFPRLSPTSTTQLL